MYSSLNFTLNSLFSQFRAITRMSDHTHDHDQDYALSGSLPTETRQPYVVRLNNPAQPGYDLPVPPYSAPLPPPTPARESAARERLRRRKVQSRKPGGEWAWVVIAAALLGVVVTISLTLAVTLRAARAEQNILPTADFPVAALPTAVSYSASVIPGVDALVLEDGTRIALQPWDGRGRLTVLVLGLDRRPGERGLGYRTDTILLMSLDPRTNEIGMLSIPRDLYVDVPGFSGLRRVNEPMVLGELREPNYGPRLAMETVQYNLGIRVNHYIVVDFNGFIAIVDAIGGVEIETTYTINDRTYPNMNYGYDPFYLPAGRHQLDGATALKFARTRHGDNDIERGKRQQQVVFAILERASRVDVLPQIVTQAGTLWNALQDNFYTDLSLEQLVQLGLFVKDIPRENIRTGGITYEYLMSYTTPQGASVLIPNRARLGNLMREVFGANYSE